MIDEDSEEETNQKTFSFDLWQQNRFPRRCDHVGHLNQAHPFVISVKFYPES